MAHRYRYVEHGEPAHTSARGAAMSARKRNLRLKWRMQHRDARGRPLPMRDRLFFRQNIYNLSGGRDGEWEGDDVLVCHGTNRPIAGPLGVLP